MSPEWCFYGKFMTHETQVPFHLLAMKKLHHFSQKFDGPKWGHEISFCKIHGPLNDFHGLFKWFSWYFNMSMCCSDTYLHSFNELAYKSGDHAGHFLCCDSEHRMQDSVQYISPPCQTPKAFWNTTVIVSTFRYKHWLVNFHSAWCFRSISSRCRRYKVSPVLSQQFEEILLVSQQVILGAVLRRWFTPSFSNQTKLWFIFQKLN